MRTTADEARKRVITAARVEFAEHGQAGARIDRISAQSGTSKERLYAYFGSKQDLWVEIMTREVTLLDDIGDVASLDGGGIVGRLFDEFLRDPFCLKLFFWQLVEEGGPVGKKRLEFHDQKVRLVGTAQSHGRITSDLPPEIIVRMLISTAANCAQEHLRREGSRRHTAVVRRAAVDLGSQILSPTDVRQALRSPAADKALS